MTQPNVRFKYFGTHRDTMVIVEETTIRVAAMPKLRQECFKSNVKEVQFVIKHSIILN